MRPVRLLWLAAVFAGMLYGIPSAGADVVISEIHYHPASEDIREDFIELLNTRTGAVDLTGW